MRVVFIPWEVTYDSSILERVMAMVFGWHVGIWENGTIYEAGREGVVSGRMRTDVAMKAKMVPIAKDRPDVVHFPLIAPFTCVEYVKRVIGLNKWWIFTPRQLMRELQSDGWTGNIT